MSSIINQPPMQNIQDSLQEKLAKLCGPYLTKRMNKREFLNTFENRTREINKAALLDLSAQLKNKPGLGNVGYSLRYDEIILENNGKIDTLLAASGHPLTVIGKTIPSNNAIFLNRDITVKRTDKRSTTGKDVTNHLSFKLIIKESAYLNISGWEKEVFYRMSGVFMMASGLIIAVIVLFYITFRALIRQRKIAEIKTDFANNITHELQTPLSSVSLVLKSIKRADVQSKPALMNELICSLDRQYQKIQQLVDHVLESTIVQEGKIQTEEVDITRYLQEYAHDLQIDQHLLEVDISPSSQLIKTNKTVILSILNVLVDNAAKYSDAGRSILLKTFMNNGYFCIQVVDHGNGIQPLHQDQIFDKFHRVPEADRYTVRGLGLGLYLARRSAASISGELSLAHSDHTGSTFELKLPL